jgi:lysophospholipase L1-like esterase
VANQLIFCTLDKSFTLACIRENLMQLWMSWSKAADTTSVYLNGSLYYTAAGLGLGAFATPITKAIIGAWASGSYWFPGNLGHVGLLNRPVTALEVSRSYDMAYPWYRISIIGDSIPYNLSSWAYLLADQYKSGNTHLLNHGHSGDSIIGHMDTQVAASAGDNANIIIMELGTNDNNNAGNMAAIQAEVEAGITALRLSNPGATLYYMNVLPEWTNSGGVTEVDNSNVRTAIAAACTAKSVTCWDTYTTPWIAAADTLDGLHPSPAGHVKIIAQVLALLP